MRWPSASMTSVNDGEVDMDKKIIARAAALACYHRRDVMRPFSYTAYFLRIIWDGVPLLFWLALGGLVYYEIFRYLGTPVELTAPFAAFALWLAMRLLRPLRKLFNLTAYSLMLLSPIASLVELAVWELLLVNDRYWSSDLPEYEGMAIFANAYRRRSPIWRYKINQILWRADAVGRPHIAKPSREFLREVEAPLREGWV
jgi:hypothetical protein